VGLKTQVLEEPGEEPPPGSRFEFPGRHGRKR